MDPLVLMLDRSRYKRNTVLQPMTASEEGDEQGTWNEIDLWLTTSKFRFYTNFSTNHKDTNNPIESDDRGILSVQKSIKPQFPGLSVMARDLLYIPLASVGVERVFNFTRDMCDYRRGQL